MDPSAAPSLKRELKLTDAAAFSVGLIGPIGVMALLGTGTAGILGRASIWAFIFPGRRLAGGLRRTAAATSAEF